MCRQVAAGVLCSAGASAKTKNGELKTKARLCVQKVEEALQSYSSMLWVSINESSRTFDTFSFLMEHHVEHFLPTHRINELIG
jgi:hypothetical protein